MENLEDCSRDFIDQLFIPDPEAAITLWNNPV